MFTHVPETTSGTAGTHTYVARVFSRRSVSKPFGKFPVYSQYKLSPNGLGSLQLEWASPGRGERFWPISEHPAGVTHYLIVYLQPAF